jgi:uncharacterized membrane protein
MDFDLIWLTIGGFMRESPLDIAALCWFLFCWIGYSLVADNYVQSSRGLSSRMHLYRVHWMNTVLTRENRVVDINIMSSLQQSMAFFASTSILILAGLLAILSSSERALDIIREFPFAAQPTVAMWYTKLALLIALFIYAFFKYTWALRQMNYSTILLGAMPHAKGEMGDYLPAARRAAMVMTMSARHMNRGLRTYYYAMAALSWFINPWFFIISTGAVVWVLYRREYRSDIVHVLNMPSEEKLLMVDTMAPPPPSPTQTAASDDG